MAYWVWRSDMLDWVEVSPQHVTAGIITPEQDDMGYVSLKDVTDSPSKPPPPNMGRIGPSVLNGGQGGDGVGVTTPQPTPVTGGPSPRPTPRPTVDPATGQWGAFDQQLPGQQFTRYLAQLEGGPQYGTQSRDALENMGGFMADLAPAFGYGLTQDIGGQGLQFAPFYDKMMGGGGSGASGPPSFGDVHKQAQGISGAMGSMDPDRMVELTAASGDPNSLLGPATLQEGLAGGFGSLENQYNLVRSNLLSRMNPFFRGGVSKLLGNQMQSQQATNPGTTFLDYMLKAGLI